MQKSYARQIAEKYMEMNPQEAPPPGDEKRWVDLEQTFQNWLNRLCKTPEKAIATTNWAGKVTQAYLAVRGLKARNKGMILNLVKSDLNLLPTHGLLIQEGLVREEVVGRFVVRGTNWFALVCIDTVRTLEEFSNSTVDPDRLKEVPSAYERALTWAKANAGG
jgi:hypothetical protein